MIKRERTAGEIMTRPVEAVYLRDTVEHVAKLFIEREIGAAPVIDGTGTFVGVISKTDLTRYETVRNRLTAGHGFHLDPQAETIDNWFSRDIEYVFTDTPLSSVIRKILHERLHHVFVRERASGGLIGIITTYDLVKYLQSISKGGRHD